MSSQKKYPCFSQASWLLACFGIFLLVLGSCESEEHVRMPTFLISCGDNDIWLQADQHAVQNLCVKVLDADSLPLPGAKVYFSRVQGQVTFTDSVAVSDANGMASVQMTPGTQAGDIVAKAQVEKLLNSPVQFYFHVTSAPPSKIEVQSGNFQEALQNFRLPNQILVKVSDVFANPVSNVEVVFDVKSGNGTLSRTSGITNNGLASLQFTTGSGVPVTTITASVGDNISTDITVYTLLPVELGVRNADDKIKLSWTQSTSPNFSRYVVYGGRSGFFNETALMETDDNNATTFEHTGTNAGFVYSYYVKVETTLGLHVESDRETGEAGDFVPLPYQNYSDISLDRQNGIFYIPVMFENKILAVSASPFEKRDSILLRNRPYRIALNTDATKMYVIYSGENIFDVVDLASKNILRTVDASPVMPGGFLTDIYVATGGQLFISGPRIAKVDESNGDSFHVIANDMSFSGDRPRFLADDGTYLYMEVSSHTPNSLFKIDISQSDGPVILEDEHGTVSGTANAVLSPDATRLYMNNGGIVHTADFTSAGQLPNQIYAVALSANGEKLYTSTRLLYATEGLNVVDATTFVTEKQWEVGFVASRIFEHGTALYILGKIGIPGDAWRLYKIPE